MNVTGQRKQRQKIDNQGEEERRGRDLVKSNLNQSRSGRDMDT